MNFSCDRVQRRSDAAVVVENRTSVSCYGGKPKNCVKIFRSKI